MLVPQTLKGCYYFFWHYLENGIHNLFRYYLALSTFPNLFRSLCYQTLFFQEIAASFGITLKLTLQSHSNFVLYVRSIIYLL